MANLQPFESTVIFREGGREHEAIVLAVKDKGVIDLGFFQQLLSADGKTPLQVIGSSRQAEMVQFRHDVTPDQYELVEDWFFGLSDQQLEALIKERSRRKEEALQAEFAKAKEQQEKALLDGVTVKPSAAVLELAGKLWTDELRKTQQLDEHTDVELPKYGANSKAWEPWIEKAKQAITARQDSPQNSDPGAASSGGTVQ